jgi:hypothetical protein
MTSVSTKFQRASQALKHDDLLPRLLLLAHLLESIVVVVVLLLFFFCGRVMTKLSTGHHYGGFSIICGCMVMQ